MLRPGFQNLSFDKQKLNAEESKSYIPSPTWEDIHRKYIFHILALNKVSDSTRAKATSRLRANNERAQSIPKPEKIPTALNFFPSEIEQLIFISSLLIAN